MKIYTGVGGMDLIGEAFQNAVGLLRVYMRKKEMRILRPSFKRETPDGRKYKLHKMHH